MHAQYGVGRSLRKVLHQDQKYVIEGIEVALPPEHRLPYFQAVYPRYDRYFLPMLRALGAHRPTLLIDVGANVGDTAIAAVRASEEIRVVAVEGNPYFVGYLRRNVAAFTDRIRVVDRFVGPLDDSVSYAHNGSTGGFVRDDEPASGSQDTASTSWVDVATLVGEPADLRIWKSDTDGFDIPIAVRNWDAINKSCGVLWLEYDPAMNQSDPADITRLGDLLGDSGRMLWIFDNVGNRMACGQGAQGRAVLSDLTAWLRSQRTGVTAVPYLDIWAFDDDCVKAVSGLGD
jgi:FkbM family methyltransferase